MAYSTPPTFSAGSALTAAQLNTYLRDNFKAIGDAWTSYSPSLTNWAIGNGTLTGDYMQVGKLVFGKIALTLGSTSTMSGNCVISLPVTKLADAGTATSFGSGLATDTSSGAVNCLVVAHATTTSMRFYTPTSGLVAGSVPWTWANTDVLTADFMYEAA